MERIVQSRQFVLDYLKAYPCYGWKEKILQMRPWLYPVLIEHLTNLVYMRSLNKGDIFHWEERYIARPPFNGFSFLSVWDIEEFLVEPYKEWMLSELMKKRCL